jgi:diguanylate cyclase (GGDEF)-like protein
MQSTLMAAAQAVALDSPYDSVFVPLVDDLVDALEGDDPASFLTAVEGRARLLAAERSLRMADVFIGLQLGLGAFRGALSGASPDEALVAQRLSLIEGEALLRAGVGFAEGLEEAVGHLSQTVAALAPTDPLTGLINATEVSRRLAVELERCRRTEVGLGAFAAALVAGDGVRRGGQTDLDELLRCSARLIAADVRRYDMVGRLGDVEFVAVLPHVSRHGVQAVLERLRHGLASQCSSQNKVAFRFAAAHLDVVDMAATDLLDLLAAGLAEARRGAETVVWV